MVPADRSLYAQQAVVRPLDAANGHHTHTCAKHHHQHHRRSIIRALLASSFAHVKCCCSSPAW
eukprot:48236-Eustigmatos_ZCMA.PRE.1